MYKTISLPNLHYFFPRTGVFLFALLLGVMRIARPFVLVALYLTAFAGYFFNYVIVCRSFALCLLFSFSHFSGLTLYCSCVRDMQCTHGFSFMYANAS